MRQVTREQSKAPRVFKARKRRKRKGKETMLTRATVRDVMAMDRAFREAVA